VTNVGIINGNFGTGDLTGWTATRIAPADLPVVGAAYAHVAGYGCRLHVHEAPAGGALYSTFSKLEQTITCGNKATLGVWYRVPVEATQDKEPGPGTWDALYLEASVGGVGVDTVSFRSSISPSPPWGVITPFDWTHDELDLAASGITAGSYLLTIKGVIYPSVWPSTVGNSDVVIDVAGITLKEGGTISGGKNPFRTSPGASIPGGIDCGRGRKVA